MRTHVSSPTTYFFHRYITGESYGGHYVPASAYMVYINNIAGKAPHVNLAGIAVGNGFVAPYEMSQGAGLYIHGFLIVHIHIFVV